MDGESGPAPSEGLHVAVRVRPLDQREEGLGAESILSTDEENGSLVLGQDRTFRFHHVFGGNASQEEVYRKCASNLIDGCFEGMNATILAYGQTGSGKTHTMGLSGERTDGIVPAIIRDLFEKSDNLHNKVHLKCQFVDIHNEEMRDLLNKDGNPKVSIQTTEKGHDILSGARQVPVTNYNSMMSLLGEGLKSRTTGATLMNATSSRSHAIFTIILKVDVADDSGAVRECRNAKLHLVDLAGSEGLRTSGAVGKTFRESGHINRGLLSLGKVIAALSDGKKKGHVPYRDSKLTRILKDSLGGNSRTVFLACVTCASTGYEETLGTLNYASRAARIKNKPVVNRTDMHTANKIRELTSRLELLTERQYSTVRLILDLKAGEKIDWRISSKILENLCPGEHITRPLGPDETSSSGYKSDDNAHWGTDESSVTSFRVGSEEAQPMDPVASPDNRSRTSEGNEPDPPDHDLSAIDLEKEQDNETLDGGNCESRVTANMLDGPVSLPSMSTHVDENNQDVNRFQGVSDNSSKGSVKRAWRNAWDMRSLMEFAWTGACDGVSL